MYCKKYILIFCVLILGINPVFAENPELDPQALQAIYKGLAAAKYKRWERSVKFFNEARRIEPASPRVLFNLALVNDDIGRELIAIAWYRAYLAAAPEAVNAREVRARIAELKTKIPRKITSLTGISTGNLNKQPADRFEQTYYYEVLARSLAIAGDIKRAKHVLKQKIPADNIAYPDILYLIAQSQVFMGDLEEALETLALIDKNSIHSQIFAQVLALDGNMEEAVKYAGGIDDALCFISELQITKGGIESAAKTAAKIRDDNKRKNIYTLIAEAQIRSGAIESGISTLNFGNDRTLAVQLAGLGFFKRAFNIVEGMSMGYAKVMAFVDISRVQLNKGDTAAALETLYQAAEIAADVIWEKKNYFDPQAAAYKAIMRALTEAGDFETAINTAKLIDEEIYKSASFDADVAEVQARSGMLNRAFRTAFRTKQDKTKIFAYSAIAEVMFEQGEIIKAKTALDRAGKVLLNMKKESAITHYSCKLAKLQAKIGDVESALKTARNIEGNTRRYEALNSIVKTRAKAGDFSAAMDTAALITDNGDYTYKNSALGMIAENKAKTGDYKGALEIARTIRSGPAKYSVYLNLIEETASAGNIDLAAIALNEGIMARTEIKGLDNLYYITAACRLAKERDIKRAKNTASFINNEHVRAWVMAEIARVQAEAGDFSAAEQTKAEIKIKTYQTIASGFINSAETLAAIRHPNHKEIAAWTRLALDYSSKYFLLDFEASTGFFKHLTLDTDIFHLGQVAGNLTVCLDKLRETESELQKNKKQ